ncbi:hypothetical protein SLE2022_243230 [Rubroshorea leprosula]
MAPVLNAIILFVLISVSAPFVSAEEEEKDEKLSAYQALQQYDFPVGLLPQGVTGYELNRETGAFSAFLDETCSFPIESYDLKYKSTIEGVISKGRITNLKGVSVKVLFFWVNIVELVRDGDEIEFSVGIASADFPIDNFFESPQCGCGLDCNRLPGFVSSSLS